ncbi:aryl-alcohol dehydrogenase-like predicted oxidoreductase [Virgibacillus natechei]|uniref:Aryl-alcohol dehydrogenase-like predicted oxidoreductase n=1 Tax=Virgibacillus natechei TaxID=1216297 RepID=A0ABS4IED6_9BACI|nr:aldo/keto reductase [Virgibacillus natechei]MBP1969303.1 aryl-alcohol dehydrogenase-like predicted oxidoreductase [Virgibacillus natechei]UZD12456.1 aldo/keto reductase [Virgibacillus natechei]
MKYNKLGNTDLNISELSFGTWAIGGAWGKVNDKEALKGLDRAMDSGVNSFDTSDVYGDGHSEELLAKATKGKEASIHIATKFCRAGDIHDPANYSMKSVRAYCENSLKRLNREQIDLFQIHCPPLKILQDGEVFEALEMLKAEGKIRHYGVSVETVEEGLFCLEHTNASALQVIFNILRQKPLEELFPKAMEKDVGILARVPLASGLLTGKFKEDSMFEADDHRNFNRNGEAFNVGETFGGLEFEKGVALSEKLEWISEGRGNKTRAALKWIIEQEAVTSVIPGFRNVEQVEDNLQALNVKDYSSEEKERLKDFYQTEVHPYIRGAY